MHPHSAKKAPRVAHGAELQFACTPGELAALREDWLRLEQASSEPCFFQSYNWSRHIVEARLQGPAASGFSPCVAVRRIGGRVTAIWPLSLQRTQLTTSLRSLDDPFGQFAGILSESQSEADALVRDCVAHFSTTKEADGARIGNVLVAGSLHKALLAANFKERETEKAPYIRFADLATFNALKSTRNKKSMKNMRNAMNSINRSGEVEAKICREPRELRSLITKTLANRMRWLTETGLTAPAFRIPGQADIMTECDSDLAAQRIGFELFLNGQSISQQWGFLHCGRYYAYMSGVTADAWKHSPGKVHLAKVIEDVMELRVDGKPLQVMEFLTPASPYKLVWTDATRDLVTMVEDFSTYGRLTRQGWDDTLRPAIKKLFYALPPSIRGRFSH